MAASSPSTPRTAGKPRAAAAAAVAIDNADESVDNMRLLNGAADSEEYIRVSSPQKKLLAGFISLLSQSMKNTI